MAIVGTAPIAMIKATTIAAMISRVLDARQ
jgi:hypothetical protein